MKKTVLLLLLTTLVFAGCTNSQSQAKASPTPEASAVSHGLSTPAASPSPIASPSPDLALTVIQYKCPEGKTALDGLEVTHHAEVTQSSLGKLVTSIDGESQGDGMYWSYTIDKKMAAVGADKYQCKGTEIIQWELK